MAYVTTCTAFPYQFSLTHDISLDNLAAICDDTYDFDKDLKNINQSNNRTIRSSALLVYEENRKNSARNKLREANCSTSPTPEIEKIKDNVTSLRIDLEETKKQTKCLNDKGNSEKCNDNVELKQDQYKRSESSTSESLVTDEDISNKKEDSASSGTEMASTSKVQKRTRRGSKKQRRKLPALPIDADQKRCFAPIPISSLAEELKLADPNWKNVLFNAQNKTFLKPSGDRLNAGSPAQMLISPEDNIDRLSQSWNQNVGHGCSSSLGGFDVRIGPYKKEPQVYGCEREFCDSAEYIDDIPKVQGKILKEIDLSRSPESISRTSSSEGSSSSDNYKNRQLEDEPNSDLSFNTTCHQHETLVSSSNPFIVQDSTYLNDTPIPAPQHQTSTAKDCHQTSEFVPSSQTSDSLSLIDLDGLEASHRGCHRFTPRHSDEIFIEIGDPIYVHLEADDLWCEGINLRTKKRGIFPSVYATDLSFLEGEDEEGIQPVRFNLQFLGSVEVGYHKGNDVLCQAIHKVALTRRHTLKTNAAPLCSLEVNEYGIKMTDKTNKPKPESPTSPTMSAADSVKKRLQKIMQRDKDSTENNTHFFPLKNVSYCGYHPRNDKYFAFVTKHPIDQRYACHIFLGEASTKCVAEAVGAAFRKFYKEYMVFVHPTEDIYLE